MKLVLQIVAGMLFAPAVLGVLYGLAGVTTYVALGSAWNPLGLDFGRAYAWMCLGLICGGAGSFIFAEETRL